MFKLFEIIYVIYINKNKNCIMIASSSNFKEERLSSKRKKNELFIKMYKSFINNNHIR